jgi:hypothetical protein
MIIQQHIYDQERNRKDYRGQRTSFKRHRPKSKSNLNLIRNINYAKEEVSL